MPRPTKFNFVAARHLGKPQEPGKLWVAFNPKTRMLVFNQKHNPEVADYKGRYVQIFADTEKRVLAWTFAPKEWTKPEALTDYDPIRTYGKEGAASVIGIYIPKSVTQALDMNMKFKRVEVEIYEAKAQDLMDNNTYYYVDLRAINYGEKEKEE